jgi:predicted DNA-binding transcriptional regulator AlpA
VTSWPKHKRVDPADLLGAGEVLELVGWKTRKSLLDAQQKRGFPPPVVVVRGARLWHRDDVQRWIQLRDR